MNLLLEALLFTLDHVATHGTGDTALKARDLRTQLAEEGVQIGVAMAEDAFHGLVTAVERRIQDRHAVAKVAGEPGVVPAAPAEPARANEPASTE